MKNIFEIFDSMNTGKINQNEILWVFSMAINGTGYYYIAKREWENSILFHFYFSSAEVAVAVQAV